MRHSAAPRAWHRGTAGAVPQSSPSLGDSSPALSVQCRRRLPWRRMLMATRQRVRHPFSGLRRERAHVMACAHVVADRLQALQYGLPLGPIQLTQERPKPLNKGVLEHGLSIRFWNEEAVQTDTEGFGNLFERAYAGGHLAAFDSRQIRTRYPGACLKLALRHAA